MPPPTEGGLGTTDRSPKEARIESTGTSPSRGSRLRIAVLVPRFPMLSETFVNNHVTGLIDAGHDVTIVSAHDPTDPITHEDISRYNLLGRTRYLHVPEFRARIAGLLAMLPHLTLREILCGLDPRRHGLAAASLKPLFSTSGMRGLAPGQFDIVHCHYGTTGFTYLDLRDRLGAPLVTSFHGFDLTAFGPLGRKAYARLFRIGDAFVANSRHTADSLARLGCPANKMHVIPAFLEDRGIIPRGRLFDADHIRILTVARLVEEKGIQYALEAIQLLCAAGYRVRYTVVGDGPYRQVLQATARKLGIRDVVEFVGSLSHGAVYAQHRRADIFVLPSIPDQRGAVEAQGLVLQEAQLHRVPAVGSRLGGIPEVLDSGRAGVLFEAGNSRDLSEKLAALIDNPPLAERVAEAGMRYTRANYSKGALTRSTEALYQSLHLPQR